MKISAADCASNEIARCLMEKSQLLTCNVLSQSVLKAIELTEREHFVPPAFTTTAYSDAEIPLGFQRFLLKPLTFARLLEFAAINMDEKLLIIGGCLGYSSAVCSHIAKSVAMVEPAPQLAEIARKNLQKANLKNVEILDNLPNSSQNYDVIIIEGAVQEIPEQLMKQLKPNGRLVTIKSQNSRIDEKAGLGRYFSISQNGDASNINMGIDAFAHLLPGFYDNNQFTF